MNRYQAKRELVKLKNANIDANINSGVESLKQYHKDRNERVTKKPRIRRPKSRIDVKINDAYKYRSSDTTNNVINNKIHEVYKSGSTNIAQVAHNIVTENIKLNRFQVKKELSKRKETNSKTTKSNSTKTVNIINKEVITDKRASKLRKKAEKKAILDDIKSGKLTRRFRKSSSTSNPTQTVSEPNKVDSAASNQQIKPVNDVSNKVAEPSKVNNVSSANTTSTTNEPVKVANKSTVTTKFGQIGDKFKSIKKNNIFGMVGIAVSALLLSSIARNTPNLNTSNGTSYTGERGSAYMPNSYRRGFAEIKELTTDFGSRVHLDKVISKVINKTFSSTRHSRIKTVNSIRNDNLALRMNKNAINHTRY